MIAVDRIKSSVYLTCNMTRTLPPFTVQGGTPTPAAIRTPPKRHQGPSGGNHGPLNGHPAQLPDSANLHYTVRCQPLSRLL